MSMVCCLQAVDEYQINSLLCEPESILALLEREDNEEVDLDKAWHGIHFLLTGSAGEGQEPLCYLVKGGEQVGNVVVGYEPARVLRPEQIRNWSKALSVVSVEELHRRYSWPAMAKEKIYAVSPQEPAEEFLDYLTEYYGVLRSFVEQTSIQRKGAIVYLA